MAPAAAVCRVSCRFAGDFRFVQRTRQAAGRPRPYDHRPYEYLRLHPACSSQSRIQQQPAQEAAACRMQDPSRQPVAVAAGRPLAGCSAFGTMPWPRTHSPRISWPHPCALGCRTAARQRYFAAAVGADHTCGAAKAPLVGPRRSASTSSSSGRPQRIRIAPLLARPHEWYHAPEDGGTEGEEGAGALVVMGWLRAVRFQGRRAFAQLDDGSSPAPLHLVRGASWSRLSPASLLRIHMPRRRAGACPGARPAGAVGADLGFAARLWRSQVLSDGRTENFRGLKALLGTGASVRARGRLVPSPGRVSEAGVVLGGRARPSPAAVRVFDTHGASMITPALWFGQGQSWELACEGLELVGGVEQQPPYPLQKKWHSPEFLRSVPHLRVCTPLTSFY
jgi:hypothetical protein